MNRRRFFRWCSVLLSGLATLLVAVPGVAFLCDPLSRGTKTGRRHRLLKLSDLEIGVPRKVVIIDQRVDAWTRYPEGPIGAVWLVRRDDRTVEAFSTICPHLGCPVDYVLTEKQYFCPCHGAQFAADGGIVSGPQRRGLDRLDVTIVKAGRDQWVSVVFQRFALGIPEKLSIG